MQEELILRQAYEIKKRYDEITKHSGENFNIFSVLGVGEKELSHSKIIAELLNPKGAHGQGDIFLKLFLESIEITDFNIVNAKVRTEVSYYNGRLDIIIENGKQQTIFIENKIWATDQPKQLSRYKWT